MRKFTFLLLFLLSITAGYGQLVSSYTFSQSTGNVYTPITGGTQVLSCLDCTASSDASQFVITLPSSFPFNGTTVSSVAMRVDGSLVLGVTTAPTNSTAPISASTTATGVIAGLGMDMRATQIPGLQYELRWEEVGDEFVFQWKNSARWSQATTEKLNFQIRINKVSGVINIAYGDILAVADSTTYQPQVGIRGSSNTDYNARNLTTTVPDASPSWEDTAAATSNAATVRFTAGAPAAFPFNGLTYKFTPPAACSTTPVAGTTSTTLNRSICSGSAPGVITITGASVIVPGISYQWEESLNGTDWTNATGGTGATTTSYTPPNFGGSLIRYRLKVSCANGGDAAYSDVTTINPVASPTTQVSALVFSAQQISSFNVAWTNGNGNRRMVVVNTTNSFTDPVNGNAPAITASAAYAGTGQQIVYDGTGTNVTITGLSCNATYYVKVYEYFRCGSGPYDYYYNVTSGTNTGSATTTQPVLATGLPSNNFSGYTGDNLPTVFPGWYEGSITTASGSQPSIANPVAGSSAWTSATAFGSTTARINLYTNTNNAWIISPKIAITANTRLKFKAAVTDWVSAAAGTTAADAFGMTGTDDKVNVLVSTDGCGSTWTNVFTINAATALTNQLTDFSVLLNAYVGQTIQIAFQATDGPVDATDQDYDFHIGAVTFELVPMCDKPIVTAASPVTKNGATINWNAPASGNPTGYQYVVSPSNTTPAGAGTSVSGTSAPVTGLDSSTTYYVFVRSVCGSDFSDWSVAGSFTTLCEYPDITGTTGGSVCGQGQVNLSATVAGTGSLLFWYDAATGGAQVGTGGTFQTPVVSATTNYYVSSASPTPGVNVTVGAGATTAADVYSNPFYSLWSNNHTQHLITAQELQAAGIYAGPITSVALDVTSAGTLPMINLTIKIGASSATGMAAFTDNSTFATVYTNASYMPTTGINTFSFTAPFVWDGTSNIVVEFCHGNSASGATMNRTVKADNTSYVSTVKRHFSAATSAETACSATTGGTVASFSLRPQFIFNGVGLCRSPRQAVAATVTTPPTIDATTTDNAICAGEGTTLNVTSANANYTYVWTPGNLSGASQSVTPATTTTYTVTATDNTSNCVATGTVTITVNQLPVVSTPLAADMEICQNDVQQLSFTAGTVTSALSGTGASNSTAQSTGAVLGPNPLQNYYGGAKQQWLYTAAELTALGFVSGSSINSIALNLATANTAVPLQGLTIKMKNTTATSYATATSWVTDLTTVKPASTHTPSVGLNTFALTTPFVWDGTSNLAVEMSFSNANAPTAGTNSAKFSNTSFVSTIYYRNDNMSAADMSAYVGASSYTYSSRNDVTFGFSNPLPTTWSPITNLYTDAAATNAYVAGAPASTVYVKSATVGDTTYTATSTSAAGCVSTDTVEISVLNCTIDWVNLQWPANGTINTCGTHDVYAQIYKAGVTEAAGAGANITAWIGVSTSNTDPATWTEAEWHLATFNTQSGNNDEYKYTISGLPAGTYYYASRFKYLNSPYSYGGFSGGPWDGTANVSGVLTVNAIAAPTAAASQTVCNSGTVANLVATGATGATFKWYSAATGGVALASTAALTNGGVYYASQTVDGCEGTARTIVTVTINAPAAPVAAASQTVCNSGTLANLNAVGGAGADISWFADATGGTALPTTTALTNGGVYYAAATISGCESATRTMVTVTVNTPAAPVAAASQTVCNSGTLANLNAVGGAGATISWFADATGGTALPMTTAVTNGGVYYAAATISGCESTTRTMVTVTVSTPAAPVAAASQTVCNAGTLANLNAVGGAGADITWFADATGGTALPMTTAVTNGGVYYAAATISGCESATRTMVTVTVNAPAAPVAAASQTVCNSGTLANLNAVGGAGADISWYAAANGGSALPMTTALTNGGVYYAAATISGCESATRTMVTVTVNAPAAPVAAASQTVCGSGTLANLNAVGGAGADISWYAAANGGSALPMTTALTNGGVYYAGATISGCESATRTMVMVTISNVEAPTFTSVQPTCAVNTGTITVTSPVGADYTYSIDGTNFQASAVFANVASGSYTITARNTANCSATVSVTIDAAPASPATPMASVTQPTCSVATGTITVTSPVGAGMTYSIDGTNYQAGTTFASLAAGTYTVTVMNGSGCTASSVVLTVNAAPAVPSAPTGATTQTITVDNAADATIEDIEVVADGTVTWYNSEEDAQNGTDAIAAGTQLVSGNTYYGTQTVGECTSTAHIAVTVDVVLGKDDFDKDAFRFYPNPVKDVLTMSYTSEISSVEVFNLLGQKVLAKQPNATETTVDMSGLSDATYIVNVTTGDAVKTIKIVKKQ